MHIAVITNEYPPHVYGGAGVHVAYLTRELARLCGPEDRISVLCFGDQDRTEGCLRIRGIGTDANLPAPDPGSAKVLATLCKNLIISGSLDQVDLVHCHTWYTHLAGCLMKTFSSAPLVLTTHSLEPHRPWKADQLGPAYQTSSWLERTAFQFADGVVAVSRAMREDVQHLYDVDPARIEIIHNGIDTEEYAPKQDLDALTSLGIDPDMPYVLFVGRLTAQKGVFHLLRAVPFLPAGTQVVLCAASPDNADINADMEQAIAGLQHDPERRVLWIKQPVDKERLIVLYSQATVFVCPSVYEPFGIINLEAMACATPVVASAVGGIPEIVLPEENGFLVPLDPCSEANPEPRDPMAFAQNLAGYINRILDDPELGRAMGDRARRLVQERFSWTAIAEKTMGLYRRLQIHSGPSKAEASNGRSCST